jgi:hypothetical protein
MLEKLNKKFVLLLVLVISFLIYLNTTYALECAGVCYNAGVCYGDVWYEGCQDSNGNLYNPNEFLDDGDTNNCLICKCTGTSCEWQPDYETCTLGWDVDYICTYTVDPASNAPSSSSCVERDTPAPGDTPGAYCTDTGCDGWGIWVSAGEIEKSYDSGVWEYPKEYENPPGDVVGTNVECCGDDSGEKYISTTIGASTYSACCDNTNDCVDETGICRDNVVENTDDLCSDGADNDCNGKKDCEDPNCVGKIGPGGSTCCQDVSTCAQNTCVKESCGVNNECSYSTRPADDNIECSACNRCDGTNIDCQAQDGAVGNDCNSGCTYCNAGSCDIRPADDNIECSACNRCDGTNIDCQAQTADFGYLCDEGCYDCVSGTCTPVTGDDDGSCSDDCTECISGTCTPRSACDSTECLTGQYCDASGGDCKTPDASSNVCLNCITEYGGDKTVGVWTDSSHEDYNGEVSGVATGGIGWSANTNVFNTLFNSDVGSCVENDGTECFDSSGATVYHKSALTTGNCCGDDPNEWFKYDYYGGECTSDVNDCVWGSGNGDAQTSDTGNEKYWCFEHEWNECTQDSHIGTSIGGVCCAGTSADKAWTPNSLVKTEDQYSCSDGIDNDCDLGQPGGGIDCDDDDCMVGPPCCKWITRECKEYDDDEMRTSREKFELKYPDYDEDEDPENEPDPGKRERKKNIRKQIKEDPITGIKRYYTCEPDDTDKVCCPNFNSCVYSAQCYDDNYIGDIDEEGVDEVCVAHSPGVWGDVGTILGKVTSVNGEGIGGARVQAIQGSSVVYEQFTIGSGPDIGNYEITDVLYGTYDMIASADDYISSTETNIVVDESQNIQNVDFTLTLGSTCEDDCTYAGDNIIHKECHDINGCHFYDDIAKNVCDLAQPGWIRDYSPTQVIECAEGSPQTKTETKAKVTCDEENLIKTTKLVNYKGKLVKLVIVTCG